MKTVPQCQLEFLHASIGSVIDTFAEASLVSAGDFALVEEAARIAILHMREVAGWRAQEEAQLGGAVYGPNAALLRAADADPLASAPALHGFAAWPQNAPALISVDGAMVRSTVKGIEGLDWFECRAGLIRSVGKDKRTVTFYTGGVKSPDEIFDQLGASWLKAIPPDCICVFVADGARWIWDRVRLYFPTAIQVLDFYHACEHIDSAAAAWHGAGTVNAAKWRNEAREKLLEPGGVRMVLREILEALRKPQNVANVDALRTQLRYIIQHRHRMRYFEIRSRRLPIGSGAMESGIKQLIPTRLRMPGMKWTKEGADAVLKVRSAHMSNSLRLTTTRRHTSLKKAVAEQYRAPLANAA